MLRVATNPLWQALRSSKWGSVRGPISAAAHRCFAGRSREKDTARANKLQAATSASSTRSTGEIEAYGEPKRYLPVEVQDTASQLPESIPAAPAGFSWLWVPPPLRTAVLVPDNWRVFAGKGELLYSPVDKLFITPGAVPDNLGMGLWIAQSRGLLGRGLFVRESPADVAEWMLSSLMRRATQWRAEAAAAAGAGPNTAQHPDAASLAQSRAAEVLKAADSVSAGDSDARAKVAAALGTHPSLEASMPHNMPSEAALAAMAAGQVQSHAKGDWRRNVMQSAEAEAVVQPDILDAWHFTPFHGLDSFGVEFVTPSGHAGSDANASGRHYHMHIAIDAVANTITEMVFACPDSVADQAMREHGGPMLEELYLNWADDSPFKLA